MIVGEGPCGNVMMTCPRCFNSSIFAFVSFDQYTNNNYNYLPDVDMFHSVKGQRILIC